jgi:signal transduction histidine kinase
MRRLNLTGHRAWHLLFAVTIAVLVTLAISGIVSGQRGEGGALVALAVLVAGYATIGARAFTRPRLSIPFVIVLIACCGVAVAYSPPMATVQAIACPLIWILLDRTRDAVVGTVVLTVVVAVAFVFPLGPFGTGVPTAVFIEGISLVGSIALGLWISSIVDRSAERQRLIEELREAQAQLAVLNRDAGVTSERERLAREIHDTIAQSLTALVLLGQRARRELASGDARAADESLGLVEETARDALSETRALVAGSAPVDLGAGLVFALERLARRFTRETGVEVRVQAAAPAASTINRDLEVVVLRCAQEALANVRKHAAAQSAELLLDEVGGAIRLTVHDDGRGFDPAAASDGYGLAGMRDRLALVRGHLDTTSEEGRGTTLTVTLPAAASAPVGASLTSPDEAHA